VVTGELKKDQAVRIETGLVMVETCIDDMNPEIFGFLMDRLFEDGALDVFFVSVYMKKNRPGTLVQVLCEKSLEEKITHRILSETSTTGVRYYEVSRKTLDREAVEVDTSFGRIEAKKIVQPDGRVCISPEYEVCRKIALEQKIPVRDVYNTIINDTSGMKEASGTLDEEV